MNWDDLRVFLAVARARTLSGAASAVGLDATTIGRRLNRLASALNTTLFEQTSTGHVLTERGAQLLAFAEEVEKATLAVRNEITGERGLLSGLVRVSVAEGFGTWIVSRHLPAFHAANPNIRIDLVASSGFLNPSKREADVAIMLARPSRGPLVASKLTDYKLRLYASRTYLARSSPIQSAEDLKRHTLVGYIPDFIYAPELRYLDEIVPGIEPTVRSSSINAQHSLIASGSGVGVLPCFIGEQDPDLASILAPNVEITRAFWLVVHQDMRRIARIDAFIEWIGRVTQTCRPLLLGVPPHTDA